LVQVTFIILQIFLPLYTIKFITDSDHYQSPIQMLCKYLQYKQYSKKKLRRGYDVKLGLLTLWGWGSHRVRYQNAVRIRQKNTTSFPIFLSKWSISYKINY